MFNPEDLVGVALVVFGLGLLPLLLMTVTSFAKIVVVLSLVRNAIGVQQVPPNMVINALALILSGFVMAPILNEAWISVQRQPAEASPTQKVVAAVEAAREPLRHFLVGQASAAEREFFMRSATQLWPPELARKVDADDFVVAIPAFVIHELTEAFRVGFLLYLAFMVVDLVVANVLVALGLQQASPTNISIPFKLLLFVVLDGWTLLVGGLVTSYRPTGAS